jgi:hypothetical protein
LLALSAKYETIIEACCTNGRYAAIFSTGNYIGIDIAAHHIEEAERLYPGATFICDDVGNLPKVLAAADLRGECLLVFPFNAFGNLADGEKMLKILCDSGLDFVIATYTTGKQATDVRRDYYASAGFDDLVIEPSEQGVRFTDSSGFNSIAYSQEWFCKAFERIGTTCHTIPFGEIGVAYSNFSPGL